MNNHWKDDKRAIRLVYSLVELGIFDWNQRHKLLDYWERIHGSKLSIRNKNR